MQKYEGKHFLFKSEFGWINAAGNSGDGYSLFIQKNYEMEDCSPIDGDKAWRLEDIVERLTENEIKIVHTGRLPEKGYCGLLPEFIDDDNHGNWYNELDEDDLNYLNKQKIDVVKVRLH